MSNITIRQAIFTDLDNTAELFDQHRMLQGKSSDVFAARAFLRERFNHGDSVVFIAHKNSEALGFAQLYPSYSSTSLARVFILNDLFIAEPGRRQGMATKLLAALEDYAWAHGAARLTLHVDKTNLPAQALYKDRRWSEDQQFFMYHRFPDGN